MYDENNIFDEVQRIYFSLILRLISERTVEFYLFYFKFNSLWNFDGGIFFSTFVQFIFTPFAEKPALPKD